MLVKLLAHKTIHKVLFGLFQGGIHREYKLHKQWLEYS
ncbi:MAG: hypothetical protein OFPI_15310 [Osedax symbiont Rs2]|nr:MAG: hypothetical protein OFPI_15310 [Osedax symbiont Rs2]